MLFTSKSSRPGHTSPVTRECAELIRSAVREIDAVGVADRDFLRTLCAIRGAVEMVLEGSLIESGVLSKWRENARRFLVRVPSEERQQIEAIAAVCLAKIHAIRRVQARALRARRCAAQCPGTVTPTMRPSAENMPPAHAHAIRHRFHALDPR